MDSMITNIRMINIHKHEQLFGGGDCIDRYIK